MKDSLLLSAAVRDFLLFLDFHSLLLGVLITLLVLGGAARVLFLRSKRQYAISMKALNVVIEDLDREKKQLADRLVQYDKQLSSEAARFRAQILEKTQHMESIRLDLDRQRQFNEELLVFKVEAQAKAQQLLSEKKLLEETKSELFKEFSNAASALFDEKRIVFSQQSRTDIESVVKPFREQVAQFNTRIEDIYAKESSQRSLLMGQVKEMQHQAQRVALQANHLVTALKGDSKVQGDWGEVVLERLLEQSGLKKGREYETQVTLEDEQGKKMRPDVVIRLPDKKDIIIDSKVSLTAFEEACGCDDEGKRNAAMVRHIASLRGHIKSLSAKKYENLEGIRSLDFVFLFVPIEPAYSAALQAEPLLFKEAYEKNIVLAAPSSLMVALRTVEMLWRYDKQNANAEKIAMSAGKLYDQFVLFVNALDDVSGYLSKAEGALDVAQKRFSRGKGNLLKRVEDLRHLGANVSKVLPDHYKEQLNEPLLGADNPFVVDGKSQTREVSVQVD